MEQQAQQVDTLEIGNLEYDVGGMGSEEAAGSEANYAAMFLIAYLTPTAS